MGGPDLSLVTRVRGLVPGECLGGALYWRDLYNIAEEVGFSPPCLVTASPITIIDKELEGIIGEHLTRDHWLQAVVGSCAGILGFAGSQPGQPGCWMSNPPTSTLQVTAALSPQLSACSRCRVAARPGRARSSTMVGSWGMSESWCLTPTSPSRYRETGWGSPGCQAVLVHRDGIKLMEQCYSAASSVILGVSFGRGGSGWEQRGCINQERSKQGWERELDSCIVLR